MSQLDLFLQHQQTAQLVSFPAGRRVPLAHAVAVQLDELDYDSGKYRWQAICRDVRNGLRRKGMSTAEIRAAIDQLAVDVHESLRTLRIQKQYRPKAVILSLKGERISTAPHSAGAGKAGALGQGTKFLAGFGVEPHGTEYDAARACEGGAA